MAIDTLAKRNSVLMVSTELLSIPDGAIGQGDRQSLLKNYSGILSGSVVAIVKYARKIPINIGLSI